MSGDDALKLRDLEEKLSKYRAKYEEKRKNFRGVRHEDSLSELKYTELKVYQDIVSGLEKEIAALKTKLRRW